MVIVIATEIIHFKKWLLEKIPIIYREANINGRLNQYRGDM
jgi:hypothetical protein